MDSLGGAVGPLIGGAFVLVGNVAGVFVSTALCFLFAAVLLACVRLPARTGEPAIDDEGAVGRVVAGVRFLAREHVGVLRALTLAVI